jgi:hypothetical protein
VTVVFVDKKARISPALAVQNSTERQSLIGAFEVSIVTRTLTSAP